DDPAMAFQHRAAHLEVVTQELAHLLLVAGLAERGEADEVSEQDWHDPSRGHSADRRGRFGSLRSCARGRRGERARGSGAGRSGPARGTAGHAEPGGLGEALTAYLAGALLSCATVQ